MSPRRHENAKKIKSGFVFFVPSCLRGLVASWLRDMSPRKAALSLEPLEQDDVVGDGRAGEREACAVARPGEVGNRPLGEVSVLPRGRPVQRLAPDVRRCDGADVG